jgi:hypothetical protein
MEETAKHLQATLNLAMAEMEMLQEELAAEVVLAMEVEILEILELQAMLEVASLQTLDPFKQAAEAAVVVLVPMVLLV